MGYNYQPIWGFLFYSLCIGFLLGFVYDFLRAFRLLSKPIGVHFSNVVTYICDILFFLCCSVAVSIFIFRVNSGRIRISAILFVFLGLLIYLKTFGRIVLKFNTALFGFIYRIFRALFGGICALLLKIVGKICAQIQKFYYFLFTRREMFRIITMMKKM